LPKLYPGHYSAGHRTNLFSAGRGALSYQCQYAKVFRGATGRLRVYQLPAYSLDYNPIEYLWRKSKRRATYNKYFAESTKLGAAVDEAMSYFSQQPQQVLGLFGCYTKSEVAEAAVA